MKCNVGATDKIIRFILAAIIAGAGIYYNAWWGVLAMVPLVTGLISFCPLYRILGVSTCASGKTA